MSKFYLAAAALLTAATIANAQSVKLYPAPTSLFPAQSDSNSPAFWSGNQLVLFNSTGMGPIRSSGLDQFRLRNSTPVVLGQSIHKPYWIESTWEDSDGTLLAWYHYEPPGVCRTEHLTAPQIGALLSRDGGRSFIDLGIILASGDPVDCSSKNGYFAGGNGDFSVVLGRSRKYFYFLFSNYGSALESQGVAIARLPFERRFNPFGAVEKYHDGRWDEQGMGGAVTPIFPATVAWQREDTDAFWGPSVHWNSYLEKFVMLLNRSCCSPEWPQEGVYVSYNTSLSNPEGWSKPEKILDGVFWYPEVIGIGPGGTDKSAGRIARLYVYGSSDWNIVFQKAKPDGEVEKPPSVETGPPETSPSP